MTLISLLLSLAAFALFGLATHQHGRRYLARTPARPVQQRMRAVAWAALALAFAAAIVARGWVMGPVWWTAGVMLGAGLTFLALNFLPARRAA